MDITNLLSVVRSELEEKFYLISSLVDDIELAEKLALVVLKDNYKSMIQLHSSYIDTTKSLIEMSKKYNTSFNKGSIAAFEGRIERHGSEINELENKLTLIELI